MLNSLIYLCILATAFQPIQAQLDPELIYYDICLKNTGTTAAFDKLRTDAYELKKQLMLAFKVLSYDRETFCDYERPRLINRMTVVAKDLEPCLQPKEKYLAGFSQDVFKEFLRFFCDHNGEYTRRFYSTEAMLCIQKIIISNDVQTCSKLKLDPSRTGKNEMCDLLTVSKECFTKLVALHCPTSNDFKELGGIFFDYLRKPCSGCIHLISSFVIVGSVLLHFFINKF